MIWETKGLSDMVIEQWKTGFWAMFTFYEYNEDSLSDFGWNVLFECFTDPVIF